MPTKPIQNILPNYEKEEPEVYETLKKFSSGLEEVVNYGTIIFKWCNEATKGKADEVIPLILSFRHCLELLDAISILIRKSSVDPCNLQLRAIFESLLAINYILEKNSKKRAYAFLVYYVHKRIKLYEKFDFNTERGKQLKAKLENTLFDDFEISNDFDLPMLASDLKKIFEKEGYSEAEIEYQRLRKAGNKNPNWYELYDGPPNIEQLAKRLNKIEYYEILYRQWSEYVHATDIISGKIGESDGQTYLKSIRQPFNAEPITSYALSFALELYRRMIDHFVPKKKVHYRVWYLEEVRSFYNAISKEEKIIIKKA